MLPARDRITALYVYPTKADAQAKTNGTEYTEGIVDGTPRLERAFFSALPAFGECNAAMFECELSINVDLKGKWIRVATKAYATDAATSRTTYWLFCGLVDDCKYDVRQATRKLVAYDEMYALRSIDVSTWWKTWWASQTGTVAVGTALSAMMNEYGVQGTAASSLANYFGIYASTQEKGLFGGGSFAQVLQYIGLVCACSFYIDVNGKLCVCLYANVNKTNTATAIDANVDTVTSVFGDAAGETFGSAQINVGSNAAYRSGTAEPTFAQNDNPLLSGYNATNYMTVATQLYTVAQKMSGMKSAEIEFIVSSPDIILERTQAISYNGDTFMPSGIVLYGGQLINETVFCTGELSDAPMYQAAITEDNIVDGAVTADKIQVNDLSALGATIGGWTIDNNAIKKTYGSNGGVWLNAPEYPSGQNSAFHAQDLYGENNLSLNYDGSLVSTCHLIGVGDDTVTLDDGELFIEKKYYKEAGNPSSEWRRGETNISGSTVDVLNSKRDNTETRDDPSFHGELSGYPEQAVVAVEANTVNGRTEIYASAQDQKAEFQADCDDYSIKGTVTNASAKIELTDGTKLTRAYTNGLYAQNGLDETSVNPNMLSVKTATGSSGNYTWSRSRVYGQTFYSEHKVYVNGAQTEYYEALQTAGSFSCRENEVMKSRFNASGVHVYDATGTEKSKLSTTQLQVNAHDLLRMSPHFAQMFATSIPSGANLNTATYLACGQYFTSSSAISGSLTNCPTSSPFSMNVEAPISATYDNESGSGEAYRIRKMTVLGGEEWVQYCYKTGTTWTYGTWMLVAIGVSKDTYDNTNMKAGNLVARRNGNVVYIVSTGNATSVAAGNWRTYVTLAAKYRPSEETYATVTNAYGEVKTVRIRTNGNVDLYTGTTISSASNFAFTATYIVD